ncbi:MAG: hypothetical protein DYG89_54385 [Caldilinea sp. CFX5]|nr:hypothetical protein [Caldilinea sp. CFX5]
MTIQTTYHLEVLPHAACSPGQVKEGTAVAAPDFRFEVWPTEQRLITQPFGANPLRYAPFGLAGHEGVDIAAVSGSKIFCVAPGVVKAVQAEDNGHNYGIHVRVQHVDGYETIYAHLQSAAVEAGQIVAAGDLLGLADSTGNATGNHLHLTLKRRGTTLPGYPNNIIDPMPFLMALLTTPSRPTRDGALYLRDRVADGSRFHPGATVNQLWTLRNSGTTTWGPGYQLVYQGGARLGTTHAVAAPPTLPGAEAVLALTGTAPRQPGAYRSYWRMRNAAGQWFGDQLWLDIVVTPQAVGQAAPRNKLGFYLHLSLDQHGLWNAIQQVQPPVLLVHADMVNTMLLEEIRRFRAPNAYIVGRLYKDNHTQRQLLESTDPAGRGRELAEEILQYNFGLATRRGASGRLLIDAWMSLNEAIPGPASAQFQAEPAVTRRLLRNYDSFQVAFRQQLQEAGVEAVAFNFAAGNFTQADHYLEYFPKTLASYRYLGFHEYGWPTLYPKVGTATSGGHYRQCLAGIRARYGDRHQVIITEAGLARMYQQPTGGDVGWLNLETPVTEEHYWRSLAWYNDHLCADAYVLGACLFQVGHHGQWASFRHLGHDNQGRSLTLIDRIIAHQTSARPGAESRLLLP